MMRRDPMPPASLAAAVDRIAAVLESDPRVRLAYLFGSAARSGSVPPRDVDVAVLTTTRLSLDDLARLASTLGERAGVTIDLVSLNDAPVVLAHEVVEGGRCLLARPPEVEVDFVTRTRSRYWDFKPYLEAQWRLAGERLAGRPDVLGPEAVRQRLLRLEEVVSRLEELRADAAAGAGEGFRARWAVERGLQLGAEIVLDVGNHILSAHFGESADDYEDVIARLGARDVVDGTLRERLRGIGGFQNILVHGYLVLDPARVSEALEQAPARFAAFAGAVRRWLDGIEPGR